MSDPNLDTNWGRGSSPFFPVEDLGIRVLEKGKHCVLLGGSGGRRMDSGGRGHLRKTRERERGVRCGGWVGPAFG